MCNHARKLIRYGQILVFTLAFVGCATIPTSKEAKQAQNLWELGVRQANRGEFRQAMVILKRGEKLDPNNYWIQEALGVTLLRMRRPKLARQHFERALEIQNQSPRAWNNLGTAYSALSMWTKAIQAYEKALENVLYQDPCNAEMNLGWAYHMSNNPNKAVEYLIKATSHCPRICQGHRMLGLVYRAQGKLVNAEEALREVVKLCSKFPPGYYRLAQILSEQKKYKEALPILQKCRDISQDKQPAVQRACNKLSEHILRRSTAATNTPSMVIKSSP
ncbi:MAG: tetratricopeptide repeat protein [Myxococcales bacterium]|nr:tetratricopeptide repeat protein [Myxococcales bacterium]